MVRDNKKKLEMQGFPQLFALSLFESDLARCQLLSSLPVSLNKRKQENTRFCILKMEKMVAAFPASSFEPAPAKKYLPVMNTTWDPAIVGLGRLEALCPHLLHHIVNEHRDVDQLKGFLVDIQAQTLMIDRIGLEAERNGLYQADIALKMPAAAITGPPAREHDDAAADPDGDSVSSWKGPFTQQMEEAISAALELVPPTQSSNTSSYPAPSYAARWHEKRRDDIQKQHPDVAAFYKSHAAFPLSVVIGLCAAALNLYTLTIYVPRVIFRTMLATSPQKTSLLESFTVGSLYGEDVALPFSVVESIVSFLSPFAVMSHWMETHLADTYKVISFFVLIIHLVLLAAVWGWWANSTAYAMTCELMMETVGSWLAVDTKPSRSRWVQQLRYVAKHILAITFSPMSISGVSFEHALLGYRGHVEHLGTGEVMQSQHRIVTGCPTHTGHLDGSLSLPYYLLMQQRRWKTVIKDKYGAPVQKFPQELLSAARLRHFVSRLDLLREEARLLENNGAALGPGVALLDSGKMEDFVKSEMIARQAAAETRNALEFEYGPQKRAMAKVILFAKEFFYTVRGASITDLRLLAGRGNFQCTDPRPLQTLVEIVHPALNEGAYREYQVDITALRSYPSLVLCVRDSVYLAAYCGLHLFDSAVTTAPMSLGLLGMHILALLHPLPLYKQTIGKVWDLCGQRYTKDNNYMYISVEGCLLMTRRAAGLMWQGLRYCVAALLWAVYVFWNAKEAVNVRHLQEELGFSSWTIGAAIFCITAAYGVLAELFALGFLWHPMWFVHATGHLTVERSTSLSTIDVVAAGDHSGNAHNSHRASSSQEWLQPTVSLYSDALFWLTFGQTLHVEQHDFPRLPWFYRAQLRQRAPSFYSDSTLHVHSGLLHAIKTYTNSKGHGVYAGQSEK
jgi:hypothetical protein